MGNWFCLVFWVEDYILDLSLIIKCFDLDDLVEKVEKCWVKIDLVSVGGVGSILVCSWIRDKVFVVFFWK